LQSKRVATCVKNSHLRLQAEGRAVQEQLPRTTK